MSRYCLSHLGYVSEKTNFFSLGPPRSFLLDILSLEKKKAFSLGFGHEGLRSGREQGPQENSQWGISEPCTMWAGQKPK